MSREEKVHWLSFGWPRDEPEPLYVTTGCGRPNVRHILLTNVTSQVTCKSCRRRTGFKVAAVRQGAELSA